MTKPLPEDRNQGFLLIGENHNDVLSNVAEKVCVTYFVCCSTLAITWSLATVLTAYLTCSIVVSGYLTN